MLQVLGFRASSRIESIFGYVSKIGMDGDDGGARLEDLRTMELFSFSCTLVHSSRNNREAAYLKRVYLLESSYD